MINCKFINIETGSFISEGSLNAGCIRAGYVTNEDNELNIKMGIAALKVVRSVEEI